jgi:hypothetical protein
VERETIDCFLEHHDLRLELRNKQPHIVEWGLSGDSTQPESNNTLREKKDNGQRVIP